MTGVISDYRGDEGDAMKGERSHVVVDLTRRLGNQLFQFAAAQQLELDGASVVFSNRTSEPFGWLEEGPERLERLTGATLPFASPFQELATGYLPQTHVASPHLSMVLRGRVVFPTVHRILRPTPFEPRPATLPTWSHYRIQSYFQHRSWFDRSLPSVLNRIAIATGEARTKVQSFDLCVSLRRGDYVGFGWDLSLDYYIRSLELMADGAIKSVVVTSDDQLTAQVFCDFLRTKGYDACTSIDVDVAGLRNVEGSVDTVLRDFCLLTNARNLIMSNSTFCWWAAALGDFTAVGSSDRIVAYPRGWLEFPDDDSDGLVRPEWTVVLT